MLRIAARMEEPAPVEDPALPALAGGRHDALAAALTRVGLRGARTVALLKHHPGSRCTLASAAGELGGRAGAVWDRLAADIPPPGYSDLRHGSFYLSHVFDLGDGPGVIDWDSFRQGPVEVDAGMMSAMAARWAVRRPNHAGAAQRAIAVFLDEVDDLVDPARLRWYRAAALLKFASYLARRRPDGWAVSAATLIGDAEIVSA